MADVDGGRPAASGAERRCGGAGAPTGLPARRAVCRRTAVGRNRIPDARCQVVASSSGTIALVTGQRGDRDRAVGADIGELIGCGDGLILARQDRGGEASDEMPIIPPGLPIEGT